MRARRFNVTLGILLIITWGAVLAQEAREFKPRLPPYYSGIVTEGQRREIYKIQERYAEKIADLQAQLEALKDEQNEEIEAVLTASQRERLGKVREEAAAKRKKPAAATKPAK
jgi:hypothetical protein